MQSAHHRSIPPRAPARTLRGAVAALGFALFVGVAVAALAFGGQLSGGGQRAAPALGAAPAPDYNSDLGTDYDPFVIANSQRRYAPAAPVTYTGPCRSDVAGCVPDDGLARVGQPGFTGFREDHGTAAGTFDWEQWERTQTGTGTTGDDGPCRSPGRSCDR